MTVVTEEIVLQKQCNIHIIFIRQVIKQVTVKVKCISSRIICKNYYYYYTTCHKSRPPGRLFSNAELLNISISIPKQTNVVVSYLSVTYFWFQFLLFVCFYSMHDWTWTTNFGFFNTKLSSKSNFTTYG